MKSYREVVREFSEYSPSAWALIVANTLPLFGVILLGWNAFEIVALYWLENVIIGILNVLKMIACNPNPIEFDWSGIGTSKEIAAFRRQLGGSEKQAEKAQLAHHASKFFLVPFFIVHYGIFCLVHGMFIFVLFNFRELGPNVGFGTLFSNSAAFLGWAAAGLGASHLYSFVRNYLGRGENRRTVVSLQMFQPYARVVVLHLAILLGAFIALALDSNIGILLILIVGKTALDLAFHLREHERGAKQPKAILPGTILHEDTRQ